MKTIKFLSLLMFVALSAGFASCSDDDDVDAETLLGAWQATYTEGQYDSADENYTWKGTWAEYEEYSLFPTFITLGEKGEGTYGYSANYSYPLTWDVDGNKLLLTMIDGSEKDSYSVKIVSQSDTEIVVKYSLKAKDGSYYEKTTYKKK